MSPFGRAAFGPVPEVRLAALYRYTLRAKQLLNEVGCLEATE